MSMEQADLLEAWLLAQPGIQQFSVHERTFCVTVIYKTARASVCRALAGFSYEKAAREVQPTVNSSNNVIIKANNALVFLLIFM